MSIVGPDVHGPQRLLRTPRMSRSVEKHLATTARRRERLGERWVECANGSNRSTARPR